MAREVHIVSAHRTPDRMFEYARSAVSRGLRVIIAGAGGAAHLPGMTASLTPLPVIGVPVPLEELDGLDSLLSIVQMPNGVPVATVGIGKGRNAALLAVRILGAHDDALPRTHGGVPVRPHRDGPRARREFRRPIRLGGAGVHSGRGCRSAGASRRTPRVPPPRRRSQMPQRSHRLPARDASRAFPRGSCARGASPPPAHPSAPPRHAPRARRPPCVPGRREPRW